jgi:predicted TIM-barrel fold metal-dependent hydrolase
VLCDRLAYPFYEVFAEAKLPVLLRTRHTGTGTGMRGGGGIRLKYGNSLPITLDKWMAHVATIAIRDEGRPLIMKESAAKLFGL